MLPSPLQLELEDAVSRLRAITEAARPDWHGTTRRWFEEAAADALRALRRAAATAADEATAAAEGIAS